MVRKNESNQIVKAQPKYIIVTISYNHKLILPVSDGFEFLKLWSNGLEIDEEGYGDDKKFKSKEKRDLTIAFLTEQDLKKIQLEMLVDPAEDYS